MILQMFLSNSFSQTKFISGVFNHASQPFFMMILLSCQYSLWLHIKLLRNTYSLNSVET